MGDISNNSRIKREEQFVFINGVQIPSIQSIQANYNNNANLIKFLGNNQPVINPRGPQVGDVSISTLVIGQDLWLQFTGNQGFNGYIIRNKNNPLDNFSFTSGYLTNYRSTCSIGEIPKIDIGINVLGNIGLIASGESDLLNSHFSVIPTGQISQPINIGSFGCMDLSLNEFSTNRVLSYDLNIKIDRNPIYGLGSKNPLRVEINPPIEVTANFEIEVNDYIFKNLKQYPCGTKIQNLNIILKDYISGSLLISYNFDNMFLLSESYQNDVNGNVRGSLSYKSYINPARRNYDAAPNIPPDPTPPLPFSGECLNGGILYNSYTFNPSTNNYIFQIGNLETVT